MLQGAPGTGYSWSFDIGSCSDRRSCSCSRLMQFAHGQCLSIPPFTVSNDLPAVYIRRLLLSVCLPVVAFHHRLCWPSFTSCCNAHVTPSTSPPPCAVSRCEERRLSGLPTREEETEWLLQGSNYADLAPVVPLSPAA